MTSVPKSSREIWHDKQCRQHTCPVTICFENEDICHIRGKTNVM